MKTRIGFLIAALSMSVALAGEREPVQGRGTIKVALRYVGTHFGTEMNAFAVVDETKEKTVSVTASGFVSPWGEGKAKVRLLLSETKGCAGPQISFTGVEMASGSYELFGDKDAVESVGEAYVLKEKVIISLSRGLQLRTTGKGGKDCTFTIAPTTDITLSR